MKELNISEECYEEIVKIIEEISGKEKAAAFRSLTQRTKEAEQNPSNKRIQQRLKNAEIKAGLKEEPTIIKNYKVSEEPRIIG